MNLTNQPISSQSWVGVAACSFRRSGIARACAGLIVAACFLPAGISAQPAQRPPDTEQFRILVSANEHTLWTTIVGAEATRMFQRGVGGEFDRGRQTKRPIVAQVIFNRDLLVFFEDGALYRYIPDLRAAPVVERALPQRTIPAAMISDASLIYAIVPAEITHDMPVFSTDAGSEDKLPGFVIQSPYGLVVYDGRAWSVMAAMPELLQSIDGSRPQPRLCLVQGNLYLFASGMEPDQLFYMRFDAKRREWVTPGTIGVPGLTDYWVVDFSHVPTLVVTTRVAGGDVKLLAFRLLGGAARAGAAAWQPIKDLRVSTLPRDGDAEFKLLGYAGAFGFNQHIGLLVRGPGQQAALQFARTAATPAEQSILISRLLDNRGISQKGTNVFETIKFVALLGVLIGLFVFRRGSMVYAVELPPGFALALNLQRLAAWLVDFLPLAVVVGLVVGISWSEGLGALASWGLTPDPAGGFPESKILIWWGFSILTHTTYTLVMELLTRRTIGKVLLRIYLMAETGRAPNYRQIFVRNILRLIELMPQFWIFGILVLLSRNHQRIGDIFARTVVVRVFTAEPSLKRGEKPENPDETESPQNTTSTNNSSQAADEDKEKDNPGDENS